MTIERRRADFSRQIAGKRRYIETKWRDQGVAESIIEAALEVLQPTGIPFLDLCLWKGRFPSRKAQFCTEELKRNVIIEQVMIPLLDGQNMVPSWQGVRREESEARRYLPECDEVGGGLFNYRPILTWPVEAVFEAHRYAGVKPNPLYSQAWGASGACHASTAARANCARSPFAFPSTSTASSSGSIWCVQPPSAPSRRSSPVPTPSTKEAASRTSALPK